MRLFNFIKVNILNIILEIKKINTLIHIRLDIFGIYQLFVHLQIQSNTNYLSPDKFEAKFHTKI